MSSFLCFICHNTVNSDTNEDMREKYRDIVGMSLCPDSHLCYICHCIINKMWMFKSICLKRSLEYPVLFSEKGTINLHYSDIETIIVCTEESCNIPNNKTQVYIDNRESIHSNDYFKLEDEQETFEEKNQENSLIKAENKEIENINTEKNNDNYTNVNDDDFEMDDTNVEMDDTDVETDVKREEIDESETQDDTEFNNCVDNLDTDYYDEKTECLNEIRNEGEMDEFAEIGDTDSKSGNNKKYDFEKIVLTLEEQKAELEAQRRSRKYIESYFKCYSCASGFLFEDSYQAHMMRHEESNGEFICELCALRFSTGALLRSHTALHSIRYRCTRCSRCVRVRQTQTHAKHCHNKGTSAPCHLCGRMFQGSNGLQQHLKRFHMTKPSNRTYPCSVCGKNYNNQAAVRSHMIKHIHRKFSCDICAATFSSPYTLTQHKKKHETVQDDIQHYCTMCGVGYSSRKSLLAHKRTSINHQQRAYECPICNRACPNEKALSSHISTVHSSTKSFCCSTCDARYTSRKSLVRHIRTHTVTTEPKIAICHLCGSSFKSKSKLNRHLREVCEKDKLEEELSSYYEHNAI